MQEVQDWPEDIVLKLREDQKPTLECGCGGCPNAQWC